jgi:hypothetical protein
MKCVWGGWNLSGYVDTFDGLDSAAALSGGGMPGSETGSERPVVNKVESEGGNRNGDRCD